MENWVFLFLLVFLFFLDGQGGELVDRSLFGLWGRFGSLEWSGALELAFPVLLRLQMRPIAVFRCVYFTGGAVSGLSMKATEKTYLQSSQVRDFGVVVMAVSAFLSRTRWLKRTRLMGGRPATRRFML